MRTSAFELIFKVGEHYYLGGTVRASHAKTELFYHFPWGSRTQSRLEEVGAEGQEHGYLPDHVSFHSDGAVHTKVKDERRKIRYINRLTPGTNLFNLPRGQFVPIYLESMSVREATTTGMRLRPIDATGEQRERCWDLSGLRHFSIILLSACTRIHPQRLLSNHGFQLLTLVGRPATLADIFTTYDKELLPKGSISGFDTQLLILTVEQTWSEPAPPPPASSGGSASLFATSICMPPMALIAKMRNLNAPC